LEFLTAWAPFMRRTGVSEALSFCPREGPVSRTAVGAWREI